MPRGRGKREAIKWNSDFKVNGPSKHPEALWIFPRRETLFPSYRVNFIIIILDFAMGENSLIRFQKNNISARKTQQI